MKISSRKRQQAIRLGLAQLLWFSVALAVPQLVMERTQLSVTHPELRDPRFVPAAQAAFMKDEDQVVGVNANGVAKAYLAHVMGVHHIIQDQLGKTPILATW